jgi:geranylgeranylglycerol-phosphate geranylgeranyltransferase
MQLVSFVTILRPANAMVSGCTAILAYLIATGTLITETALLFLIVFVVTGAGNTINDYFDAGIDRINRPGRPIPSGAVSEKAALSYALILFTAGIALSFLTNAICAGIAVFNSLVLILYAARFKGIPFIGNLTVSYLAGSIFVFGGALAGIPGILATLPLTAITFSGTLARELLKDAEDVEGDSAFGAKTIPLIAGIRPAAILALAVVLVAIAFSFVPFLSWGVTYLLLIGPVDLLILAAGIMAVRCDTPECLKSCRATLLLKAGMFAALAVFAVSAVFL